MALLPHIEINTEYSQIILEGPNLTDDNVVGVLSKLPKCKSILMVDNRLGDEGVKALLRSGLLRDVQMLRLLNCNIGDEGALALVRSSTFNNLVHLHLYVDRISADGMIAIAEHLPGTKIMTVLCHSINTVSIDTSVHEAFYQAALTHKILEMCDYDVDYHVGDEARRRLESVLNDNSDYVQRVKAELLEAVTSLGSVREMNYPVQKLGRDMLKRFERFYFHPELGCELKEKDPVVCRRIVNYMSDNYFRITEIVCGRLQCDDRSSASLASLPTEALREITKYLQVADVKTKSE